MSLWLLVHIICYFTIYYFEWHRFNTSYNMIFCSNSWLYYLVHISIIYLYKILQYFKVLICSVYCYFELELRFVGIFVGIWGSTSETIKDDNETSYQDKVIALIFIPHDLREWLKTSNLPQVVMFLKVWYDWRYWDTHIPKNKGYHIISNIDGPMRHKIIHRSEWIIIICSQKDTSYQRLFS